MGMKEGEGNGNCRWVERGKRDKGLHRFRRKKREKTTKGGLVIEFRERVEKPFLVSMTEKRRRSFRTSRAKGKRLTRGKGKKEFDVLFERGQRGTFMQRN